MKFFTFAESRNRGSYMMTVSKLVGSYSAHVKTLVRQYEVAMEKKEICTKWLMLWTYQSQVALAYISAYPSEPEIVPKDLVEEMMTKLAAHIDSATLLSVIQFFVENNEEEAAIFLAQKAISTIETNKKLEIMNVSITCNPKVRLKLTFSTVHCTSLHEASRSTTNARHCHCYFQTATEHATAD